LSKDYLFASALLLLLALLGNSGLSQSGLVGERELSEVATDHIEFDFDFLVLLAVVNSGNASDHFGDDQGISEMGLDDLGSFSGSEISLRLFDLFGELEVLALDTVAATEFPSGARSEKLSKLILLVSGQLLDFLATEGQAADFSVFLIISHGS